MGGLGPRNCGHFSTFLKIYMELLERKALNRVIWRREKEKRPTLEAGFLNHNLLFLSTYKVEPYEIAILSSQTSNFMIQPKQTFCRIELPQIASRAAYTTLQLPLCPKI